MKLFLKLNALLTVLTCLLVLLVIHDEIESLQFSDELSLLFVVCFVIFSYSRTISLQKPNNSIFAT